MWQNNDQEYYYDKDDWVRLRVESEQWEDLKPVTPSEIRGNGEVAGRCAYMITVSTQECLSWGDLIK